MSAEAICPPKRRLPGPEFSFQPNFLASRRASWLLENLWRELSWQHWEIVLFGKHIPQPRLSAWCSDPGIFYRYSGLKLPPSRWHPELDQLRIDLKRALNCDFNSVLVNAYRDGADSMGWHADDESELGPEPLIASLSLGATRRFLIRPKNGGSSTAFDLERGNLLVMRGKSQQAWQHCVPKTRKAVGLRINLTFRLVHPGAMAY